MLKDLKLQYGFTEFHYSSLDSEKGKTSNSPCLRPLRVVREVLQVLADPQVLEYRLFRLGLEDLSLPKIDAFFVFHVRHAQSVKRFCMWQQSFCSYRSTFLSSRAWWSLRARTSRKTCRSGWACRTTLTRRTLHPHHGANVRNQDSKAITVKKKIISGTSTRPNRSDLVLCKERTVHIIILCKSPEQLRVGTLL